MKLGFFWLGILLVNLSFSYAKLAITQNQEIFISCTTSEPQPEKKEANGGNQKT
ncbi:hypothetical protein NIES4101_30180 [Calothrix sp. NIES-4101]|nr:hypothetical protein NIES4101_30180 [Calothrix sp. NIES-4101]